MKREAKLVKNQERFFALGFSVFKKHFPLPAS